MKTNTSTGKCAVCGGLFGKAGITRHLKSCLAQAAAESSPSKATPIKSFHLLVEGRYAPDYWLHLEVPAAATLEKLDRFLRRIWLECCGHMSAFTIEGTTYSVSPSQEPFFGGSRELSMKAKLYQVLRPGLGFRHEYDFGTTTELNLKVIAALEKTGSGTEIRVLARNEPPVIPCFKCQAPATQVCSACAYQPDGWLCDKCAREHECGEDMFLPVVNSPRTGMCGYTG